jgi:superoxide dismutase, Cu-Zn family
MKFTICLFLIALASTACKTYPSRQMQKSAAIYKAEAEKQERLLAEGENLLKHGKIFAKATFEPRSGSNAQGMAWFLKDKNYIKVVVKVKNVSKGAHGIHIHEIGDCSAKDASSAGEHFNPAHLTHGDPNPSRHHMGDLGNIIVQPDGLGVLELIIPKESANPDVIQWKDIIGKSLVLHANRDDLSTQPSGKSGGRIACGIIVKD